MRWLVVRAAGRAIAIPVAGVEAAVDVPPPLPAPGRAVGMRGVVPIRGRLVALAHLGSVLGIGPMAAEVGSLGVVVRREGWRLVLEVDDLVDLVDAPAEGLPRGWEGAWANGALRTGGGVIPVLDVDWLVERLARGAEGTTATA
jgi:chemotaxis signal transduction protein